MQSASRGPDRILARGARAAPASPPADGARAVPPCDRRGHLRRPRPARCATRVARHARAPRGRPGVHACHYPTGGRGARVATGVVTGGKSGLRASGGKGIAKKIAREAFVTGWYGAAIHKLPGAALSADADVGAARRNPVPLSRSSRCLAGRRPAVGTLSHSEPDGGSAQSNGEADAARDLSGSKRRPGNPPVLMMPPSRGARRCKRGRGRSLPGRADEPQRWQARRAETGLAATFGYRHAAAAALDGKRKGVKGTLAALAAAPPVSHSEATDRPLQLSYPTPAPAARCGPGAR